MAGQTLVVNNVFACSIEGKKAAYHRDPQQRPQVTARQSRVLQSKVHFPAVADQPQRIANTRPTPVQPPVPVMAVAVAAHRAGAVPRLAQQSRASLTDSTVSSAASTIGSSSAASSAITPKTVSPSVNPRRTSLSYEATPAGASFVSSLATVLTHLVSLSSQNPDKQQQITHFHAVTAPDISIKDYLERIQKYFGCSNECFVLSLVYIDRVVKIHHSFTVSILNIHRLLITSIMLAAKFFDDVYYSNAFYARVGGVRTREINLLEWQFLALINYHLYVPPREYDQYRKNVMAAVNAGIQRPLPAPGCCYHKTPTALTTTGAVETAKPASVVVFANDPSLEETVDSDKPGEQNSD